MPSRPTTSEKILARIKGLRNHLHHGEEPLFTVPAIWDAGQGQRSMPCDVILTNSRLIGYVFVSFPRERLFLDALTLTSMKVVSLRHKTFEPLFRELLVSDGQRKVFIRAPRQKIENLYAALRSAIEQYAPTTNLGAQFIAPAPTDVTTNPTTSTSSGPTTYGRQEIRTSFEGSPLGITLLFTGGLALEILGAILWAVTQSLATGLPLFAAGLIAVITAILVRRSRV